MSISDWSSYFFSKHKTACALRISDWSSDVCSSDLQRGARPARHGPGDAAQCPYRIARSERWNRPVKKPAVKRTFRLDAALCRELAERARSRRMTRTDIVEEALAFLLKHDQEARHEDGLARRRDRLARQIDQRTRHNMLSKDATPKSTITQRPHNP